MTPDALSLLHKAAFHTTRGWSASEFDDLLKSPLCFVVGDETGVALGRVIVDEVELLTIAVLPEKQGLGHGAKWLRSFENVARTKGALVSFLEVAEDNTAAIALYESAGYKIQTTRPRYYTRADGQKVDAKVMSHKLG